MGTSKGEAEAQSSALGSMAPDRFFTAREPGQRAGRHLAQAQENRRLASRSAGLPASSYSAESRAPRVAGCHDPRVQGQASVIQVRAIDDLPAAEVIERFREARSRGYQQVIQQLASIQRAKRKQSTNAQLAKLRRRLDEIAAIDFFGCALRYQAENLLQRATEKGPKAKPHALVRKPEFQNKTWVTRPRPGIDRVSSAWLIRRFIDPAAKLMFSSQPAKMRDAIPFDTFEGLGFTHKQDHCTFETLCNEFAIRDPKTLALAQMVHDADLRDDKFGRAEGKAIEAVLVGWAEQSISDDELLKRGMELFDGLYRSMQ